MLYDINTLNLAAKALRTEFGADYARVPVAFAELLLNDFIDSEATATEYHALLGNEPGALCRYAATLRSRHNRWVTL